MGTVVTCRRCSIIGWVDLRVFNISTMCVDQNHTTPTHKIKGRCSSFASICPRQIGADTCCMSFEGCICSLYSTMPRTTDSGDTICIGISIWNTDEIVRMADEHQCQNVYLPSMRLSVTGSRAARQDKLFVRWKLPERQGRSREVANSRDRNEGKKGEKREQESKHPRSTKQ